jgi:hypothetical protein
MAFVSLELVDECAAGGVMAMENFRQAGRPGRLPAAGLTLLLLLGLLGLGGFSPPPPTPFERPLTQMILSRYATRSTVLDNGDSLWTIAWQLAAVEDVTRLPGAATDRSLVAAFVSLLDS